MIKTEEFVDFVTGRFIFKRTFWKATPFEMRCSVETRSGTSAATTSLGMGTFKSCLVWSTIKCRAQRVKWCSSECMYTKVTSLDLNLESE